MTDEYVVWVNVKLEDPDLVAGLDKIAKEDDSDRSKTIRKLIRQEVARRSQLPLPLPIAEPARKSGRRAVVPA